MTQKPPEFTYEFENEVCFQCALCAFIGSVIGTIIGFFIGVVI